MFAVVTISARVLGYHAYWMRERRKIVESVDPEIYAEAYRYAPRAPGLLWMFGESGQPWVYVSCETDAEWEVARKRAGELFPEAEIERLPEHYRQFAPKPLE